MLSPEKYNTYFEELGIYDSAQRENILGSLFQLANLIYNGYEEE